MRLHDTVKALPSIDTSSQIAPAALNSTMLRSSRWILQIKLNPSRDHHDEWFNVQIGLLVHRLTATIMTIPSLFASATENEATEKGNAMLLEISSLGLTGEGRVASKTIHAWATACGQLNRYQWVFQAPYDQTTSNTPRVSGEATILYNKRLKLSLNTVITSCLRHRPTVSLKRVLAEG